MDDTSIVDRDQEFTIELPRTDGLPFLDTLTKPTSNSMESTVYRKPTHTDRYLDYNSNHPISAKLSVIHILIHRAKQVCSTPEFFAKEMDHLHEVLQDNHYPTQFFQQGKPQQKTNKKPNHPLLMHPTDPMPDAQKTDIIYHWKCPANNCTAEYIGETNRSLKERVSDHRNQITSAIRNHHISTKTPKSRTKRFYNNRQGEQHPTPLSKRSTSHFYQGSITQEKHWQSQNPFSIQQTSQATRQLELPHSSIPPPKGAPSLLGHSTQKTINTSHLPVMPMFTPFKLQDN